MVGERASVPTDATHDQYFDDGGQDAPEDESVRKGSMPGSLVEVR